ncbi:Protein CBR-MIF-4 [Caenorhabditis briggsae]|uniref:Protein CBR-MIF-4 n=1 Tax=Caenorhabditis briggsae TaxID=6238 RepID=A8WZY2_CAEBR|nr:Protein CBR-MIF-4 [Caenorhabditis briggsae]CAP25942.1 Protein CBR-MIF-4 [Caenorhabditis briggsae]
MQIVRIQTNIRAADVPEKLEQDVSYGLSVVMEMPSDKFVVIVEPAVRIRIGFEAKETTVAVVQFQTTRPSPRTENDIYAKKLTSILCDQLKLDSSRIFISFDFRDAKSFATQGKTIASLYE